jgi:hypothetical protein
MKGQAFIAVSVIVSAHELIARMADEHRSCHELKRAPAMVIAKGAATHIGNGVLTVEFDEGTIFRPGCASTVDYRNRTALYWCRDQHRLLRLRRAASMGND